MSSLFYVKAGVIADHLRKIPDVLEAHRKCCCGNVLPDTETHYNIVISSPSVCQAIRKAYVLKTFRARIMIPKSSVMNPISTMEMNLAIYDANSKLLYITHVADLSDELSLAIEVELFSLLLKSKGIDINPY